MYSNFLNLNFAVSLTQKLRYRVLIDDNNGDTKAFIHDPIKRFYKFKVMKAFVSTNVLLGRGSEKAFIECLGVINVFSPVNYSMLLIKPFHS